ncbi:hypothetical protein SK854_27290 [Lentzea sp. BCCO 10_0061]|uniref:Uncharacterized protein n=1 Tax=Lentzea sokolovensis TaxID=3095429 RepID=A0ABU4V229_9PSEU|nr:hypothetical protein [Lentzea sp. BCCO 10_0061]MDX8145841.1 hypothetical protein [Lentzea sp. BCCO 10_0061]
MAVEPGRAAAAVLSRTNPRAAGVVEPVAGPVEPGERLGVGDRALRVCDGEHTRVVGGEPAFTSAGRWVFADRAAAAAQVRRCQVAVHESRHLRQVHEPLQDLRGLARSSASSSGSSISAPSSASGSTAASASSTPRTASSLAVSAGEPGDLLPVHHNGIVERAARQFRARRPGQVLDRHQLPR